MGYHLAVSIKFRVENEKYFKMRFAVYHYSNLIY